MLRKCFIDSLQLEFKYTNFECVFINLFEIIPC